MGSTPALLLSIAWYCACAALTPPGARDGWGLILLLISVSALYAGLTRV